MRVKAINSAFLLSLVVVLLAGTSLCASASAVTARPAWMVSSVAEPTNFSAADNAKCSAPGGFTLCDSYLLTVINVGGGATTQPINLVDTLPPGLKVVGMRGQDLASELPVGCDVASISCGYGGAVNPGDKLAITLEVEVTEAIAGEREVTNAVRVEGGGASPASTSAPSTAPNTINGATAGFGIADFGMTVPDLTGSTDRQAADHPNGTTTLLNFNTLLEHKLEGRTLPKSVEAPRNVVVTLPLGFAGDPLAATTCTAVQLIGNGTEFETECPASSRVGTGIVFLEGRIGITSPIYNMVTEHGFPAKLGFKLLNKEVSLYASLVHTPSGYALRVATPGLPRTLGIEGAVLSLFGDPNLENGETHTPHAFFTNPADCAGGAQSAKLEANSWDHPGVWSTAQSPVYPNVAGCDRLQFEPMVEMHPEVTEAEAPSGFEIDVKVPQNPSEFPVLATPDLKNVTVTLPEGMVVSPGAADGLTGCPASGPEGIDMPGTPVHPDEAGEGEKIGVDGLSHLAPGHCPPSSQVGTVEVHTPLLKEALKGHVYLAQPLCGGAGQRECTSADATDGQLFGLYVEAEGSGVVIKLGGRISANPATGQLTTRFTELPQQPVSEVSIHLEGGARAPLANPRACGAAVTSADFASWGSPATPDALWSSPYAVDWDGNGGLCPGVVPFAPTLTAGTSTVAAGHSASFALAVQRGDRMKDVSRLQVKLPPGLLGTLAGVTLCGEPQAARGECSEASKIGDVTTAVGSGSHPFVVNGGRAYLTGGYGGAPFGVSVVVPAVAGPFNLGKVVVRAAIGVDPATAAITVTSAALPQFLDGVPLRIQSLVVNVDRPGFMFNPTNCARTQTTASIEAEQGGIANVTSPFAVEGCNALPFKPGFAVSTRAQTSKKQGASLSVKVTSGPGQVNIGRVVATLPKQLPARLTTLQQACPEATFAQNPAGCPAASAVGIAKAVTPVLNEALTGPAYLVSHGGAAFPDLVVILQGQGVRLDLTGNTNIKKGVTTSTFASVPDAPISSFELKLPQGPHSALAGTLPAKAKGSFCGSKLTLPTTMTAQNGAQVKQNTKIAIAGCPKAKPKKAKTRRRAGA